MPQDPPLNLFFGWILLGISRHKCSKALSGCWRWRRNWIQYLWGITCLWQRRVSETANFGSRQGKTPPYKCRSKVTHAKIFLEKNPKWNKGTNDGWIARIASSVWGIRLYIRIPGTTCDHPSHSCASPHGPCAPVEIFDSEEQPEKQDSKSHCEWEKLMKTHEKSVTNLLNGLQKCEKPKCSKMLNPCGADIDWHCWEFAGGNEDMIGTQIGMSCVGIKSSHPPWDPMLLGRLWHGCQNRPKTHRHVQLQKLTSKSQHKSNRHTKKKPIPVADVSFSLSSTRSF